MAAERRSRTVVPALLLALALPAAPLLTACSSSKSSGTASSTPATTAPATTSGPSSSTAAGTTVTVTEKEFSLALSQSQFAPGSYTFVGDNTGSVTHALAISGPGVSTVQTSSIPPGSKAQFTVTLQAGSYELWCPIDGHKALGMDTHIQVGGASTSPSNTGSPSNATSPSNTTSPSTAGTPTASSSASGANGY
ncbi:hypothetical protein [Kitasatospora viridis]|uniref:Putative cupredoxin-like copper-binding protein n=2 Tax=Kitasatospora viridis TaxID=281105 RepID=A0A561SEH5_9ACTN|nr:hypothetical protein [Kitasatospora viridis]TWF73248.1 putative cupredoxin-like copper-binding protein [Kitasatospora viridis]